MSRFIDRSRFWRRACGLWRCRDGLRVCLSSDRGLRYLASFDTICMSVTTSLRASWWMLL